MFTPGSGDTWTDGLPLCHLSGVGLSANQAYGRAGSAHEYEDRSLRLRLGRSGALYAVFDGYDGAKAAYFASQRLPAELSFNQITPDSSPEDVVAALTAAFSAVEEALLASVDPSVAERTQLLDKLPSGPEATLAFPETTARLEEVTAQLRGGCAAVVALLHREQLFVANVGDCRALLCRRDRCGVLKVKQLSEDHTTQAPPELARLAACGLPAAAVTGRRLGATRCTRCLGDYFLKGGRREHPLLGGASGEPVTATPRVTRLPVDQSCCFLLLLSAGLYTAYEEATGSSAVNRGIAALCVEQFAACATLTAVAQAVVDAVVRMHHDLVLSGRATITAREDITLLIRNFSCKLKGGETSVAHASAEASPAAPPQPAPPLTPPQPLSAPPLPHLAPHHLEESDYSSSTSSSSIMRPSINPLNLDEQGYIQPYVSFAPYYQALERLKDGDV